MKKKHPEHVNLERWLVSYADFITLLFAFFVVMYAMANQDKAKVKQITDAIERTFSGPSSKIDAGSGAEVNIFSQRTSMAGQVVDQPMGHSNAVPEKNPELEKIAERIEESLAYQFQTTDLKDTYRIIYDDRGLVIRFTANKLFEQGSEIVRSEYLPLIDRISKVIANSERLIRIEGHTDNVATEEGGKFPTNWELSTARAAWIVRYMRAKWHIPSSRLSAAGFADGQPVATNKTEQGRSLNNRVEIVVTNIINTKTE